MLERPRTPATALLALLLLSGLCAGLEGLNTLWSLPLGLAPSTFYDLQAFATDGSRIYGATPQGMLFAVNASDAAVLWGVSTNNNSVSQILVFPEIPELVYVGLSIGFESSLQALRRSDGAVVGVVNNLTVISNGVSDVGVAVSGRNLALWHNQGVYMTDRFLNVLWRRDASDSSNYYYNYVAANEHIVATVRHTGMAEPLTNMVSFDARTGAVVCNISNVSFGAVGNQYGLPFVITPSNLTLGAFEIPELFDPYHSVIRLIDLGKCKVIRTFGINSQVVQFFSSLFLQNVGTDGELLVNMNLTNGKWVVTATPVSERVMTGYLWSKTLSNVGAPPTPPAFPLMAAVPFRKDTIAVWTNTTLLVALDAKTGAEQWRFPHLAPATATMQNQFVFPVGPNRVLVPNGGGYVVFNEQTGIIETNVDGNPIFSSAAILPVMNATSHTPFAVFIDPSGNLVAVN